MSFATRNYLLPFNWKLTWKWRRAHNLSEDKPPVPEKLHRPRRTKRPMGTSSEIWMFLPRSEVDWFNLILIEYNDAHHKQKLMHQNRPRPRAAWGHSEVMNTRVMRIPSSSCTAQLLRSQQHHLLGLQLSQINQVKEVNEVFDLWRKVPGYLEFFRLTSLNSSSCFGIKAVSTLPFLKSYEIGNVHQIIFWGREGNKEE